MIFRLAILVAKFAGLVSRNILGKSGETIPGKVLLTLFPDAISKLSQGRIVILVSGTNGKSSTSRTLASMVSEIGTTTSNFTGSNLDRGIATALMRKSKYAVLEIDELFLPSMIVATKPAMVLLLNLSRDQLHRMHEVRRVASLWHEAVAKSPQTLFVGDIDDPFIAYALSASARNISLSFGGRRHIDASACPSCGIYLEWQGNSFTCHCGLTNANPTKVLSSGNAAYRNYQLATFANKELGGQERAYVQGDFERTIAAKEDGISRIRLVKNPASWSEALASIESKEFILILNSRQQDGLDISWIWDIDFSALAGKSVRVTGERGIDMQYRLHVAGIETSLHATYQSALSNVDSSVQVLASYSAFHELAMR